MDLQKLNAIGRMETFLPTKSLSELTVGGQYHVTKISKVQTKYGSRFVVELNAAFTSFLPARFARHFEVDFENLRTLEAAVQSETLLLKYFGGQFNVIEFEIMEKAMDTEL